MSKNFKEKPVRILEFCQIYITVNILQKSPCGEMDITTVFGTVIPGSNPGGGIELNRMDLLVL